MEDILKQIFGEGRDLHAYHMASRSFVMFFIALILVRISGMRSFGSRSAFDIIVVIMLGAILSRGVMGVSPFLPTIIAGLVLCVTHRLLAMVACRVHFISVLLKGNETVLYKEGTLSRENLLKCDLSRFRRRYPACR
jgi:uncharacterized membrane protein YcaP (DUF421 family)